MQHRLLRGHQACEELDLNSMPELSYQRSTVGGGNEILEVDRVEVDAVVEVSSRPDIVPAWKTRYGILGAFVFVAHF